MSDQQETSNEILTCPDCKGNLVVNTEYCMTSYPCQHDARCESCGKTHRVYGSNIKGNPSCGPYHLDFLDARNAR